jgi:hypothetical protein
MPMKSSYLDDGHPLQTLVLAPRRRRHAVESMDERRGPNPTAPEK